MRTAAVLASILLSVAAHAAAPPLQKDTAGCKDHPLFTRMPTYWIHHCSAKEFDAHDFILGKGKKERVEGRLWTISYYPQATATSKPSELQILRNFEAAVARAGGASVFADKGRETFRLNAEGKEIWVDLTAEFTGKYGLAIVERAAMAQDIVADAKAFANDLNTTGHAAVYGIYFDTNKAEIKAESAQAIGEIAKLLQADPGLKLFVVGHTDGTGGVESNLKLSQERAQAVIEALVSGHGVAAARLRPFGNGPFAPVATNATEEGRAKNRRVELVKL
ncbi:MAG: OmpA family protein [Thermoanaerobaculaceae bacterium]|nr:OmpA family protein [Thermoanaerobaculaceae bacterium]TAM56955.1 MAG: OmpA family protein [Acidobacteriota bacterium]